MVSKAFFTRSKHLVEENDGRHDVVRYDGERFLAVLSTAGRKVLDVPLDADDRKTAYLKALVRIDDHYFDAREFEAEAQGQFFKYDDDAEQKLRFDTARRLSDCVADLRALLGAHDALAEVVAQQVEGAEWVNQAEETERTGEVERAEKANRVGVAERVARVRATLLACTDRAVSRGWFPIVQSYHHALSPGELVAEGRERRNQRIGGTENSTGIAQLLEKPHFEKLTERDLRRIRESNRESPGTDPRVWKRLREDYRWFLARERAPATPGRAEDGG